MLDVHDDPQRLASNRSQRSPVTGKSLDWGREDQAGHCSRSADD